MTKKLPPSLTAAGPEVGPTTRTRNGFATARAQTQNACHCSKFKKARTSCLELISLPVTRTTLIRNGPSPGTRRPVWSIRNFRKTPSDLQSCCYIFCRFITSAQPNFIVQSEYNYLSECRTGANHWNISNQSFRNWIHWATLSPRLFEIAPSFVMMDEIKLALFQLFCGFIEFAPCLCFSIYSSSFTFTIVNKHHKLP